MDRLTERQVIGMFYKALAHEAGASWVGLLSNYFTSDQKSEEYPWLGQVPMLREWIGGRLAKGLREQGFTIRNKPFEATLDVLVTDLRRDKSGQLQVRIAELARRSDSHWASLLSTLIAAGESETCYDGQYFFDTDHSEGDSGTQDNDITVDISAVPAVNHGITTAPSVEEMQWAIFKGIEAIVGFKDDQGEPMNEDATQFLVMVPLMFMQVGLQAVATPYQASASQLALSELQKVFSIKVVPNARLTSWTDRFSVFRTDSNVKALIRQEEVGVQMKVKGYGSEYEFDNNAHQYGIDCSRNADYGYWQNACLVTLT